jgi:cytochrome c oxidase assembly factor CtaG
LLRPWVSIIIFSVVMIIWHLPGPFDLAYRNLAVHIWLMHGSYFAAGILFWLQFLPSPPFRIRLTPVAQAAALIATNCVMWALAMAMGFLSSTSWYSVYNQLPGVTLPAFADQQIGAGILWICGDFWAIPTMIFVIRRLLADDGSVSAAIDRVLGRGSRRYNWANRG